MVLKYGQPHQLKAGEDFSIGSEVVNRSKDSVFISNERGRWLYQQFHKHDDFLSVYRKGSEEDQQLVYIGKPYDPDNLTLFPAIYLRGNLVSIGPFDRQHLYQTQWSIISTNRAVGAYSLTAFGKLEFTHFGPATFINELFDGNRYIEAMNKVSSYRVSEGELFLYYGENTYLLFHQLIGERTIFHRTDQQNFISQILQPANPQPESQLPVYRFFSVPDQ